MKKLHTTLLSGSITIKELWICSKQLQVLISYSFLFKVVIILCAGEEVLAVFLMGAASFILVFGLVMASFMMGMLLSL